jgi:hypothetical protein
MTCVGQQLAAAPGCSLRFWASDPVKCLQDQRRQCSRVSSSMHHIRNDHGRQLQSHHIGNYEEHKHTAREQRQQHEAVLLPQQLQ